MTAETSNAAVTRIGVALNDELGGVVGGAMETLEQCNAAGAEAGASGLPFSECPYTFARANVDQRTFETEWRPRLNAWFAGWKRTAPPVKKKFNPRWHKAT